MSGEDFGSISRRSILTLLVGALVFFFMSRLIQLQIVYYQEFGRKSVENSVRVVTQEPLRGYIFDRRGRMIVDIGPSYSINVIPIEFNRERISLFARLLMTDPLQLDDRIARGKVYSNFIPVRVARDVNFSILSAVEEYSSDLPGVSYAVESKRLYPSKIRASHLLGYVKEIGEFQLTRAQNIYQRGDMVGSAGIEASYEPFLRGQKGFQYVAVNAQGQLIGKIDQGRSDVPSKEGFDLYLAMDLDLQAVAESLMTNRRGAVVAIDPRNGGILALVSKPDFDPNIFSGLMRADDWQSLNTDENKPLFNRATLTRYPPGSTFKMVLAAAGLETGAIDAKSTITCSGGFFFGNRLFRDLHVHGTTDIEKAIQQSCNTFFYKLILKVGLDTWSEYGRKFGFGSPTGIDIGEETSGLLPSTAYYNRVYGEGKWTQGYVVSLSVGQGELGVSPLQMARYAAALANGGTLFQPHAVSAIVNKRLNQINQVPFEARSLGISPKTMALIREGMRRVVEEPGGTGGAARVKGVQSAGKTGTAQNPHGDDHAWYIGFAPYDNPRIAIAVLLENAGFGGAHAAPIARQIIERHLINEKILESRTVESDTLILRPQVPLEYLH
jgi:penicillin-binding protein 2